MILLVGSLAFLLLVAHPAFRRAADALREERERFDRLLLGFARWSLLAACLSALLWLWVQAALMSGLSLAEVLTLDTIGSVLTRTQFGRVWQLRLGLLALLGAFFLFGEGERDGRDRIAFRLQGLLLGGASLVALAWAGHAAATKGQARLLHLAGDSLHLFAVGAWLGGLLPLWVLLGCARGSPNPSWAAVAREATRRFSLLGVASVGGLTLTGALNGWILVGGLPPLLGTSYGRLLLLKLALLLPVTGLGARNLLRLKPQLLSGQGSGEALREVLRRLRRNVVAEASLGAVIVAIVGALAVTPPARHVQPTWPFAVRLSWEANKDAPGVQLRVIAGSVFALWGLGAVGYGCLRRFRPGWLAPMGAGIAAYGTWIALSPLAVDAYPTTYLRPAVPYSALSVASGARLYEAHCAICHGVSGYGDGPAARGLRPKPADLTAKHTADHTAGDLFWWLTHGIKNSGMPGFKDRLSEQERWDLINFLRALASAEQSRTMGPLADAAPRIAAPDFTFGTGVGPSDTLKDHRGWAMVHLVLFTLPGSLPRLEQLDRAWTDIGLAGARVLAVPMREANRIYRLLGPRAANFPILVEGSAEIVDAYALFRRTPASEGVPPIPPHMEFLIDRQGYMRARWIPGEGTGWEEIPRLLREIERLAKEAPRAPAPEEHVH